MQRSNYITNSSLSLSVFTEQQKDEIHSAVLEVLEDVGIEVHSAKALEVFKKGGAFVSGNRVRIPPAMVEKAIRSAPSRVVLSNRLGERKLFLENNNFYYGAGPTVVYTLDPFTGEHRESLIEDTAMASLVMDALDNIDYQMDFGSSADVRHNIMDVYAFKTMIENSIKPNTKMVICTHASNVTGTIMPIKEIGGICRKYGILLLVDAAQSAGILDIDVEDMAVDLLAVPGHKGLMGMQGTGILYIGERTDITQLREGGTGSSSEQIIQPMMIPDRYESGTLNLPGIVSVNAGISFIKEVGLSELRAHDENLTRIFLEGVKNIKESVVYGNSSPTTAVAALNLTNISSSEFASILDEEYDICTRAGLHCAPLAHKTLGTLESAAVRFSFGFFNTVDEVNNCVDAIHKISGNI